MQLIRATFSVLFLVLLAATADGWVWTASHQTPAQVFASHLVLGASILTAVVGLVAIWTHHPAR